MLKILKRLPVGSTAAAIAFLLVQAACALYLPYVTADIVNKGVLSGDIPYIWQKGLWMIGLSVLSLIGAIFNVLISAGISYRLGGELRDDIYRKALRFSKNEFDKFGTASLITRNTNDVTQVQNFVEMGLQRLIISPAYLVGGIVLTWQLAPRLALVFLGAVPFLAIAAFVVFRYASPLYMRMQKTLDRLNRFFREGLTGVKVIRAFNKEEHEYEKYRVENREYTKTSVTAGTIMSVFIPLITMLMGIATIIVVWLGGKSVSAGGMQIGSMMAAVSYSAMILTGFGILTSVILAIPRGRISAERITEVLDTPISINDPDNADQVTGKTTLALENVDFRYRGAKNRTLEGIRFELRAGQTLAVVGGTGDGKSTLVNLMSRLYDVENGCVKLNGTDIRDMKQSELHKRVSFSPQKSTLFFGTIRSNMLLGKPDATDDEIWAALDMAQATEFIRTLDQGLDSVVEKGGGNFSGGQKQRLCIARALLKDAELYIFDDSFSALDFKTDAAVRSAMRQRVKEAMTVIVAQRISTVRDADLIAVLDKGKLAGLGGHDALLAECPVYREIVNSQIYKEGDAA